ILYAADHGADVINMSLGGAFPKSAAPGLVSIFSRVLNYANRRGTLIVVAAGNEAADLDRNGNIYSLYCNSPHVVCVSATGPAAALVAMMGPGNPSQSRARLQSSSDDLGAAGTDPFYGHGRLNAGRAVGALP